MKHILSISLIMFAAELFAQNTIPAGTILPVALNSSLNSRKVKSGQVITARVMQDVPLPGSTIHAGAKVIGRVIDVKPANGGSGVDDGSGGGATSGEWPGSGNVTKCLDHGSDRGRGRLPRRWAGC